MKWLKRLDSKNAFYPSHNVIIILLHHSLKKKEKKKVEKWSGKLLPYTGTGTGTKLVPYFCSLIRVPETANVHKQKNKKDY